MWEYMLKAGGAWFVGFFPLAEIYVAIPAAFATGLDTFSVVFWSVFGNFTPVLLIHYLYEWLLRFERVRAWLENLVSEKAKARINRYGGWFVLLVTPWTGVWVMAATAKALGMQPARFMLMSLISITVYAIALVLMLEFGAGMFSANS